MKKYFIFLIWMVIQCSYAVSVPVSFSGTLIEPPACTINSGGIIDVNFGEQLSSNRIDGENYRQVIPWKLTCPVAPAPLVLRLIIKGNATSFENTALQTSKADLGIRLLSDGKRFELNKLVPLNVSAPPVLEAVPISRPASSLTEGAFSASATLLALYL
ncbi:fimbrial protein [Pantoea eucrina]|uniref:Fimbrial protein n=1 Tax=Pantoea eucrina TaxID=472693 RepID=A0ABU5LEJ0_9GAMM|nr:fimbrial protein [Pantoea eucrina]MDZ7278121.1 fimbrial protein [Pantoea eucrina]